QNGPMGVECAGDLYLLEVGRLAEKHVGRLTPRRRCWRGLPFCRRGSNAHEPRQRDRQMLAILQILQHAVERRRKARQPGAKKESRVALDQWIGPGRTIRSFLPEHAPRPEKLGQPPEVAGGRRFRKRMISARL